MFYNTNATNCQNIVVYIRNIIIFATLLEKPMKTILYIFISLITFSAAMGITGHAQSSPDHLFKDDEPENIRVNVLIADQRNETSGSSYIISEIKSHLKSGFPEAKFHFVDQKSELKRSGDYINIMISIKSSGIAQADASVKALTHYHVTIYDVSKTPIYIKDGDVKFDVFDYKPGNEEQALQKTQEVANQRLINFLERSIKHKSFQNKAKAQKK